MSQTPNPPTNQPPGRGLSPALILLLFPLLGIAAAILVLAGAPNGAQVVEVTPAPVTLPPAPPVSATRSAVVSFALEALDGRLISLNDYQGEPVIINFWATWCPPCEREMPAIAQFASEHPDVNILSINIGETADVVAPWLEDRGIYGFPVLLDLDTAVSANYGAINIPVTYGLDTDGVVQLQHYGEITIDDLEALVESLNSD
ncbi:MAG: TlpA family protein disulfide reductase [Anaerolineae bacterium]|nr:TlpA family protein disulfide reductase [Anaerolineae bacterium]